MPRRGLEEAEEEQDEKCRTPKGAHCRIPEPPPRLPPPPRKLRPKNRSAAPSVGFFESPEIDEFFATAINAPKPQNLGRTNE